MSKEYVCDCCNEVIFVPHEVTMKEFYLGYTIEDFGVVPTLAKRKVKIHLCENCFLGLKEIAKKVVNDRGQPPKEE